MLTPCPFPTIARVDRYGGESGESLVELLGAAGNVFRAFCDDHAPAVGDVLSTCVFDALELENDFDDVFSTGREPLGIEAVGEWDAIAHGRVVDLHDDEMLVDAADAMIVVDRLTHDARVIGSLVRLVLARVELVPQSSYPGLFERPGTWWTRERDASFSRFLFSGGTDASSAARWSGRVLGPTITREQVEQQLGPPSVIGDRTFGYELDIYPHHVYTFELDEHERQRRVGFRRRGDPVVVASPPRQAAEWPAYIAQLTKQEVTEDELVQTLGEPIERTGWWPSETLRFASGLEIELRHGIVQGPDHEA